MVQNDLLSLSNCDLRVILGGDYILYLEISLPGSRKSYTDNIAQTNYQIKLQSLYGHKITQAFLEQGGVFHKTVKCVRYIYVHGDLCFM